MKNTLLILFLIFANYLPGQTILSLLDSIAQNNDTASLTQFCERWHLDTKGVRNDQIKNDTIKEMYELLESAFYKDYFDSKEPLDFKYFVFQDFITISVQDSDWDFEQAEVELEIIKKKKRREVSYKETFVLNELKQNNFELYKKGFKKYFIENHSYTRDQVLVSDNFEYFTNFCPKLENSNGVKPIYLIGKYKAFSEFTGGNCNPEEFYSIENGRWAMINSENRYLENVKFVEQVLSYPRRGVRRVMFNKHLNRAAVYNILPCYTGYVPLLFEKVNGKWIWRGYYWDK